MSSSLPYTLALRTVHCDKGLPFTEDGWKQARTELARVYGTTAKALDKATSLNAWQQALKQAGQEKRGRGITNIEEIANRAQELYTKGSSVGLTTEEAYTQKKVRDWIKANFGANAPYIKLDDALYVMLRHFNKVAATHVLNTYIGPMIHEIARTPVTVRPAGTNPPRKGAFLSANLYVEGLRNRRRVGPNGQKMTLNPHTKKYTQRVGPRYPRKNPGGAAYLEAAGHTYGKDKRYLVASTKKKEKKKQEAGAKKMAAQFKVGMDAAMAGLAAQQASSSSSSVPTTRRKRARVDIPSSVAMDTTVPLTPSEFGPALVRPFPGR